MYRLHMHRDGNPRLQILVKIGSYVDSIEEAGKLNGFETINHIPIARYLGRYEDRACGDRHVYDAALILPTLMRKRLFPFSLRVTGPTILLVRTDYIPQPPVAMRIAKAHCPHGRPAPHDIAMPSLSAVPYEFCAGILTVTPAPGLAIFPCRDTNVFF
jgi:hypothetical protein